MTSLPKKFSEGPPAKRKRSGRPIKEDQLEAFNQICTYLENNDEEQLTITYLHTKMKDFLEPTATEPFGIVYFKSKLKEKYGDAIYFAEEDGNKDIVTMKEKTSQILRAYFNEHANDEE